MVQYNWGIYGCWRQHAWRKWKIDYIYFDFNFEVCVGLNLEHQVNVDSCEGQTWRIYFLPFDIVENYILWNNFDADFI